MKLGLYARLWFQLRFVTDLATFFIAKLVPNTYSDTGLLIP